MINKVELNGYSWYLLDTIKHELENKSIDTEKIIQKIDELQIKKYGIKNMPKERLYQDLLKGGCNE